MEDKRKNKKNRKKKTSKKNKQEITNLLKCLPQCLAIIHTKSL